jgi:hypothetical protein
LVYCVFEFTEYIILDNILNGNAAGLEIEGNSFLMIAQMIRHKPADRCGLNAILSNYYFWPAKKCLAFFNAACKTLKQTKDMGLKDDLNAFHSISIGYKDWRRAVSADIYRNRNYQRKFRNVTSDLVLAIAISIRCNNFTSRPSNALWNTWSQKFPCLLPFTYGILRDINSPSLRKFYQYNSDLPKFHNAILGF